MSDEDGVLTANGAFYGAFAARDAEAMDDLWAKRAPVVCIHPGWQPLRGRQAVMASWWAILGGPGSPPITCHGPTVQILDDAAFVVCIERLPGLELVATNIFVREDAEWKLVHHHASGFAHRVEDEEGTPSDSLH